MTTSSSAVPVAETVDGLSTLGSPTPEPPDLPDLHSRPDSEPTLPLGRYGWTDLRAQEFAALSADRHIPDCCVPGRVVRAERTAALVATERGVIHARQPAAPRSGDLTPCTGDWVAVDVPEGDGEPLVHQVLRRYTALTRSSAGREAGIQVLAANVDTIAVVITLAGDLRATRLERMVALAWESGARPVVVLTKADLSPDIAAASEAAQECAPGVEIVVTSALTGLGADELSRVLTGTIVLLGSSGAGKSSLGNLLLGSDMLATRTVRDSDGKGRHTTAWRELVPLPSGAVLIDTPGLRTLGMVDAATGIERTFSDVELIAQDCRFADCGHDTEPGCAVMQAIDDGVLSQRRLDSYRKLLRENEFQSARSDARVRSERAARWRSIHKQQRAAYDFRVRNGERRGQR